MTDRQFADPSGPPRAFDPARRDRRDPPPVDSQPTSAAGAPAEAPKDALEAQQQAFKEHAEEAAVIAQREADAAVERATSMSEQPEPVAAKPADPLHVASSEDVVIRTGPRYVNMVTTEDDRLLRHKQMIAGHLRNATPDMSAGKTEDEIVDPQTRLPRGHLPEGYQDTPRNY